MESIKRDESARFPKMVEITQDIRDQDFFGACCVTCATLALCFQNSRVTGEYFWGVSLKLKVSKGMNLRDSGKWSKLSKKLEIGILLAHVASRVPPPIYFC